MNNPIEFYVRQTIEGQTEAFEKLYQLTNKRIYFICLHFLGKEDDANDAVQDTYLTAFKNIRQLSEPFKFTSWLERIAVNRCKNIIKKKKPIPVEDDILKETLLSEDELTLPEKYIIDKEKRRILMDIMRTRLTELQYQAVILYYFNNLSVAEIAEIMECSQGAVMNRLSKARANIRAALEEYQKDTDDKLFVFAGVPFLTRVLDEECKVLSAPDLSAGIMSQIRLNTPTSSESAVQTKFQNTGKVGKNIMSKKVIVGTVAGIAVIGAAVGIALSISGNHTDNHTEVSQNRSDTSLVSAESSIEPSSGSNTAENEASQAHSYGEKTYLDEYDFGADGLNGNIKALGGAANNGSIFIVKNDNTVYKPEGMHFSEYLTLDDNFDKMLIKTTSTTSGGASLLIQNSDDTYSLYPYTISESEPVTFKAEDFAAAAYSDSMGVLNLYSLEDSSLFITIIDKDGKVLKEHQPVKIDEGGARLSAEQIVAADDIKDLQFCGNTLAIQKNNGTLYYSSFNDEFIVDTQSLSARNGTKEEEYIIKTNGNYGMSENTDRLLGHNDTDNAFYSVIGEENKFYIQPSRFISSDDEEPEEYTLPNGYTTKDIQTVYHTDDTYVILNDGSVLVNRYSDDRSKWSKAEGLTEMNQRGSILEMAVYQGDLLVLCDDNTVYKCNAYSLANTD